MNKVKVAAVAATFALVGAPAHARPQLDIRREPTLSGPISADAGLKGCKTRRQRVRPGGRVVGVLKICVGYYRFDPASDTDAQNDYGAFWARAKVRPRNGWCVKNVKFDLLLPKSGALSRAPKSGTRINTATRRRFVPRLKVDAQGNTATPARIKQAYWILPGTLRAFNIRDRRLFRTAWRGRTKAAVAFAEGVELRWAASGPVPKTNGNLNAVLTNDC